MRKLATTLACLGGTLALTGAAAANLVVGVNDDARYESAMPAFFMPTMKSLGLKMNAVTIRWDESTPTTIAPEQQAIIESVIANASLAGVTVELDLYPLHSQVFTNAAKSIPSLDAQACGDSA